MKYRIEERLEIGRRIYEGEISRYQAAEEYEISWHTARDYMRLYRQKQGLPIKRNGSGSQPDTMSYKPSCSESDLEAYEAMSKDELIRELVRSKIREARLKKGYEVKGVGAEKEFILLGSRNTK